MVRVLIIIANVPSLSHPDKVTYGFIGDSVPPVLPMIKQAPLEGLEHYMDPCRVAWPSSKELKAYYKNHERFELMETACEKNAAIPKLMFVPTTWIGAFLEPSPPLVAYERATYLKSLLPKNFIHMKQIKLIVHWTRAACIRNEPIGSPDSQMMIPWRNLPEDGKVQQCVYDKLTDLYPHDFPEQTTNERRKTLTEHVRLELQMLRLKAISFFNDLRSFEFDPTSIHRTVEENEGTRTHQETLHQLLVVIFSYYQKVYPPSDLEEVMLDLLAQDVITIPAESVVGVTNEYLHTHTAGYHEPDKSDIVNIMEKLSVNLR
jgi:hypothetical protein